MKQQFIVYRNLTSAGYPPRYLGKPDPSQPGDIGLYNDPNFATVYDSPEEAAAFMNDVANLGNIGRVIEREAAIAAWQEKLRTGFFIENMHSVSPDLKKPIELTGNQAQDRKALLNWWLEVYQPASSNLPQAVYRERHAQAYKLFPFLRFEGYWNDTLQTEVRVHFMQKVTKRDIQLMKAEIEAALPLVKETQGQWDRESLPTRRFGVMEPSLSAHGSFYIETAKRQWRLTRGRFRHQGECQGTDLSTFLVEVAKRFSNFVAG